jgi:hypothetical protein
MGDRPEFVIGLLYPTRTTHTAIGLTMDWSIRSSVVQSAALSTASTVPFADFHRIDHAFRGQRMRPTGITLRLDRGDNLSYRDVAKWARTSVQMVADLYDQAHPEQNAARVAGGRKG